MLQPLVPIAPVYRSVVPIHFSVSNFDIILIMTLVPTAGLPNEFAVSLLFVIFVSPLILITIFISTLFPVALAVFLTIEELAGVYIAITPHVLAESLCFTVLIFADVGVTYSEVVATLSMSEALLPFSFILIAVAPKVLAEAIGLVQYPLPYVAVALQALPQAVPFLLAKSPLTIEHLATCPNVFALPVDFAVVVLTLINITITEPFVAEAMPFVVGPFAFVDSLRRISYDTLTVSL